MRSVHEVFAASAALRSQADFLFTDTVTARSYGLAPGPQCWAQAAAEVQRLRRAYAAAGYGHGHRIGLRLENRPAFFHHWFALNALGVSVVPIHADLRQTELAYLMAHSGICLALTLPGQQADLCAAAQQADPGPDIVAVADTDAADANRLPSARTAPPRAAEPVGLDSECALLYTSGTTGQPKGCMLDNAYFLRTGQWYAQLDGVCQVRPGRERVMTPLPLNHVNALAFSTMVVLTTGGCLVQLDRFHPASWLRSARESGATIVHYLGVMPALLLAAAPQAADRGHAIGWGFGAGVAPEHHAPFEQRFGFPLVEIWAMTETGAAACIMDRHEPRQVGTGCFGRPEDFVQTRLIDEAGCDVPDGVPGELLVRSSGADPQRHFFSGYLKDAQATQQAWADGWLHTGDLVRRDGQGRLYFVDRKKNLIRRSGENIAAAQVESVLNQHPAVQAAAVAATPDALRGDEVLACIVTRAPVAAAGQAALAADIVAHALAQLAYYKAPGYVAFVDALPLTPSQKIRRGELRAWAQQLPGQPGCIDTRPLKKRPL